MLQLKIFVAVVVELVEDFVAVFANVETFVAVVYVPLLKKFLC